MPPASVVMSKRNGFSLLFCHLALCQKGRGGVGMLNSDNSGRIRSQPGLIGLPWIEEFLVLNLCLCKKKFSATGVRRISSQRTALALTGNGLGMALISRAPILRDIMEVHRIHAYPSKYIISKTAEVTGIVMTGQWKTFTAFLQAKARRHAVTKTRHTMGDRGSSSTWKGR